MKGRLFILIIATFCTINYAFAQEMQSYSADRKSMEFIEKFVGQWIGIDKSAKMVISKCGCGYKLEFKSNTELMRPQYRGEFSHKSGGDTVVFRQIIDGKLYMEYAQESLTEKLILFGKYDTEVPLHHSWSLRVISCDEIEVRQFAAGLVGYPRMDVVRLRRQK